MVKKKSLIFGISGQDGAYLSKLLIDKGYEVYGTSRDVQNTDFFRLKALNIYSQVNLHTVQINNFQELKNIIEEIQPNEIYNLSAQSSVGLSFQYPLETFESICNASLNILESIRILKLDTKFYNACSSESFGNTLETGADENTAFSPKSPYGVAKASSYWQVANFRESYNLFACNGILFNHESILRDDKFVTKKIIHFVSNLIKGKKDILTLGNLSIKRDWGYAPEYVESMWLMLQEEKASDFVIGTGECNSLENFVKIAFSIAGFNWQDYTRIDKDLFRPSDILISVANPEKAKNILKWSSKYKIKDIIQEMIEVELKK